MKAVFLAAGRGSRLGASDLPKPLWEIGPRGPDDPTPETILGRQIDVLKRCGVKEIAVVVGFRADLVREKLADRGVTFVENTHPDITASGSAHSFSFAARSKFAASRCVLVARMTSGWCFSATRRMLPLELTPLVQLTKGMAPVLS